MIPLLALTAFTVVLMGSVAWVWASRTGGLSQGAIVSLALAGIALFLLLVPLFLRAFPNRPISENIIFALWAAAFVTLSGVALWLRYRWMSRG